MREFKFTNHNLDVVSILTDEDKDLEITKFQFTEYFEELTAAVEIRLKKNFSTRDFVENGYVSIIFENEENGTVQVKNFRIFDIKETETEIEFIAFWHNLEMLNEILPPYKNQPQRTLVQHMEAMGIIPYPQFKLLENEETSRQMTIEYEGEGTKLKRLVSLLNAYDCEGRFKELDADGEVLGLAIYKKDNSDRRVGQNRPDVDISGLLKVEANYNIEEVYNAIKPTGDEGIVIPSNRQKIYRDDDGNINFELKDGAIYSRSSINAFPATLGSDKIVMAYKEINTSSVDKLESEALKMLKLHHMPKITLTVSTESTADFVDLEIGDTVSFNLENFFLFKGRATARVEKKVSDFINDTATYELSNFSKFNELATNTPTEKILDEYDLIVELSDPDFSEADLTNATAEQTIKVRGYANGEEVPIERIRVYKYRSNKEPELLYERPTFTHFCEGMMIHGAATFAEDFLFIVEMAGVEIKRRMRFNHVGKLKNEIETNAETELREIVIAENYQIEDITKRPRVLLPESLLPYMETDILYTMTSDCADYFYLTNKNGTRLLGNALGLNYTTAATEKKTMFLNNNSYYVQFERLGTRNKNTSGTVNLKFYVSVYKDGTIPNKITSYPLTVEKLGSINASYVGANYGYFNTLQATGAITAYRARFTTWLESQYLAATEGTFTNGTINLGDSVLSAWKPNNISWRATNGTTHFERLSNGALKVGSKSLLDYRKTYTGYSFPYGIKATITIENEFCTISFYNSWTALEKGVSLKMSETLPEDARPLLTTAMPIVGIYAQGGKSVSGVFGLFANGDIFLTCPDATSLSWSGTVTYVRNI